jgi:hypothetical protein
MAFDTRAYAKHLKQAGVKRRQARAHVEAMDQYLRPDLVTRSEIAALEQSSNADLRALEQRLDRRLTVLEQPRELPVQNVQMQALGIMAATLGILFALRKLVQDGRGQQPEQRRIASGR